MDHDAQRLDVVRSVGAPRKVGEVELDLVPALVQAHGHRADERLHARRALVVRRAEPSVHLLVVQHRHLERKVLLQLQAGDYGGARVRF